MATQYKVAGIHTSEKSFCVIVSVLIEWSGSLPSVFAHPRCDKTFANRTLEGATVGVPKEKHYAPFMSMKHCGWRATDLAKTENIAHGSIYPSCS